MMDGIGHGWGMGFGWLIVIIVILLIIWAIIRFSGRNRGQSSGVDAKDKSALDVLKDRYARGEIDKSEFEEKRKDLIS